jgi:glycosyltransferase involved in cell wall biosynthesis
VRPLIVDLGRDYRGGQDQALLLLKGLMARGHAPELITIRDSLLASRAKSASVPVHVVGLRWRQFAASRIVQDLLAPRSGAGFSLWGLVRARTNVPKPVPGGVDLIHANEPHALTAAWLARAHHQLPVIASRRVIFPLSKSAVSLARYRAASRIVAVSQCVASAVAAAGLAPDRITVIPDGVPIPEAISAAQRMEARRSLNLASNALVVGCVAALTPDKGQDILIRALPAIRAQFPQCELLLPGEGPCRDHLGALARECGVADAVHFIGFVEDIGRVYAAIDLFAFPAQAEALGTALLLAMAQASPVVALARGGIPEVVENGKNGLLVANLDPETFASSIARLFANPGEAARLGAAARATVVARFSVDQLVEETISLYERLVADGQRFNSER